MTISLETISQITYPAYQNMPKEVGPASGSQPISWMNATLMVAQIVSVNGTVSSITDSSGLDWAQVFSASGDYYTITGNKYSGLTLQVFVAPVTTSPVASDSITFNGTFADSSEAIIYGLIGATNAFDTTTTLPASTDGPTYSFTYGLNSANSAVLAIQAASFYPPSFGAPIFNAPSPQAFTFLYSGSGYQGGSEVGTAVHLYAPGTTLSGVTTIVSALYNGAIFALLGIAGSVPNTTVPNVIGDTLSAANSAISGAVLVTGTVREITSSSTPGTVIAQAPAAGTTVPQGTPVNLTLSGVSTMSVYGKFAPAAAYPPTVLINATGIEPRIYIPKENVTVKA